MEKKKVQAESYKQEKETNAKVKFDSDPQKRQQEMLDRMSQIQNNKGKVATR